MLFGLIPREEAFFKLFKQAAHNMIEGSRLLKVMMEDFGLPSIRPRRSRTSSMLAMASRMTLWFA